VVELHSARELSKQILIGYEHPAQVLMLRYSKCKASGQRKLAGVSGVSFDVARRHRENSRLGGRILRFGKSTLKKLQRTGQLTLAARLFN